MVNAAQHDGRDRTAASASTVDDFDLETIVARGPVVLFDGECNLCRASVRFIAERDPVARFRFAAMQSDVGRRLLARSALPVDALDTMTLISGDRTYQRSAAALRIAGGLKRPWPLLVALLVVPAPIRDAAYRFVARRRHVWFGKRDTCMVPTEELRSRFVDDRPS